DRAQTSADFGGALRRGGAGVSPCLSRLNRRHRAVPSFRVAAARLRRYACNAAIDGECVGTYHRQASPEYQAASRGNRTSLSVEARMSRIAVIGAGAWGTGLAIVMGRSGNHQVRLWAHEKEVRDSIVSRRVNELFLPGPSIPATGAPTGSLQEGFEGPEVGVSVMPSQHCRPLFQQMLPHL